MVEIKGQGFWIGPLNNMGKDTDLEEGECKTNDDTNIDLDINLSYIDEKLQSVLGHFQKDFDGGAENLGATYGEYGSFFLEEDEASDDDSSIDHDIAALSYIDEKLQSLLGHFEKDFEEGAKNLWLTYGAYGSFLHTYRRLPTSSWSQPKGPKRVELNITESPYHLQKEDATFRERDGTAEPRNMHSDKVTLGDEAEMLPLRHQPSPEKSLSSHNQKNLKFRIKVGSNKVAQKNVDIYKALGLDSPSSSPGNSPPKKSLSSPDKINFKSRIKVGSNKTTQRNVALYRALGLNSPSSSPPGESCGIPFESRENPDKSPTRILQQSCSIDINCGSSSIAVHTCKKPVKRNLMNNRKFTKNTIKGSLLCADDAVKENSFELVSSQGGSKLKHQEARSTQDKKALVDYWVLCDRCEQWRLLPNGRTPDQFPETWVCSMLDWLPGMNSCNFTEDETTEAIRDGSKKQKVNKTSHKGTAIPRNVEQAPVRRENWNVKQSDSGMKLINNLFSQHLSSSVEAKLKRKSKRVSDQHVHPIAKKVKTEFSSQPYVRCH